LAGKFVGIKCDLRKDEDISAMFSQIRSQFGRLDICINNAGLANNASLIDGSTDKWREMVDVNIIALSIVTREAVQLMIEKNINDGQIIQISSMSGHRVVANKETHFYSATKHAVKALTEGLRQEMRERKLGIRVCEISPGMVKTEFASRLHNDKELADKIYSSIECIQSEDIAQVVLNVIKMPPHVEVNEVIIRPTQQIS
jgi:17beta-estradiol 17-dehydrogenase / 3beta-hydroxysteroid 3-dehydrogenase